jgi:hypothetical protein
MNRLTQRYCAGAFALLALLFFGLTPRGFAQSSTNDIIPLRILYAGKPGSSREADFLAFLRQHFRQVNSADLPRFNAKEAADADVVLFDYDGDGFRAPQPNLPADYARPTITLGVAGGMLCSQLRLKTGYM